MPLYLRLLLTTLFLGSAALLAISSAMLLGWLDPPHPATLFTVDANVKDFGQAPVGDEPVLTFKFKNDYEKEIEILGGAFG